MSISIAKTAHIAGAAEYLEEPTDVKIAGNYAYVAAYSSNSLTIINVSDPSDPVRTGQIVSAGGLLSGPQKVYVSGNYAYVVCPTNYILLIIDISSKISPSLTGYLQDATSLVLVSSVYVSGNYAYVVSEGYPYRFVIIDISSKSNPVKLGEIIDYGSNLYSPKDLYVSGNYAYVVCAGSSSLTVIDIVDKNNPVVISCYSNSDLLEPYNLTVSGNYAYIPSPGNDYFVIIDISNPLNPSKVGSVTHGTYLSEAFNVSVSGSIAYIAAVGSDYVTLIDISDVTSPSIITQTTGTYMSSPFAIAISNSYAFVAASTSDALTTLAITLDAPTNLSAAFERSNIRASWTNETYATSYKIYYNTSSGITKTTGNLYSPTTNPCTFAPSDVRSQYVTICSVNGAVESALATEVFATYTSDYRNFLLSLLPYGRAWTRNPDSVLAELLYGLSMELTRFSDRMLDFLDEMRVTTTEELIEYYEDDYGIPDNCTSLATTLADRRSFLQTKLQSIGKCNKGYFENIGETLGFAPLFIEHKPAWSGVAQTGFSRCGSIEVIYYTSIAIDYNHATYPGDELLSSLYCMMVKYTPAHRVLLFDWRGPGFDSGFSSGFDSEPYDTTGYGFSNGFDKGFDAEPYEREELWSGGFDLGFNMCFDIDRNVDLTVYYHGGFDKGFSSGFDTNYYITSDK